MKHLRAGGLLAADYLPLLTTVGGIALALALGHTWPDMVRDFPLAPTTVVLTMLCLGLGLSLVVTRRALRGHYVCGGPLAVQGLWICPILALSRPREADAAPAARPVSVHGVDVTPLPPRPLRVLVVEDDPVARHVMVRSLEGAGFEVEATDDGAHALFILGYQRPDVMVLDLLLPTLNGADVARAQRALEASYGHRARIVVVTGLADAAQQAQEFGAAALLHKPVEGAQLVRTVAGLVPAHQPKEETPGHERPPHAQSQSH